VKNKVTYPIFCVLSSVFRFGSLRSPPFQTDDHHTFNQTYTQLFTPGHEAEEASTHVRVIAHPNHTLRSLEQAEKGRAMASKTAADRDCRRVTPHRLNNPIFMSCKMPEFSGKSPLSGAEKTPQFSGDIVSPF